MGLDPYDMADKANIFSVRYSDVGFLPIFVVITNDGNQPVSLTEATFELVTVDRTKIPAATDGRYLPAHHPLARHRTSSSSITLAQEERRRVQRCAG